MLREWYEHARDFTGCAIFIVTVGFVAAIICGAGA